MITRFRAVFDRVFRHVANAFDRAGISPNTVTCLGLVVVGIGAVLVARGLLIVGAAVAGAGAVMDLVDGLLARRTAQTSPVGGYLDSLFDRYTDGFAFAAIGWYYDEAWIWAAALLGFVGAAATSYAKARLYEEVPPADRDWSDLIERPERQLALWFGAGFQGIGHALGAGVEFLPWVLLTVAVLGHVTVVQRGRRALQIIRRESDAG